VVVESAPRGGRGLEKYLKKVSVCGMLAKGDFPKNSARGMGMQTAKNEVTRLLSRLPEDCSLEDIQYHLYVLQKVERGFKDAEEGRVYTQEEVEKMMSRWTEM
jgi:predicted transcriptional regulator